MGVVVVVVVVMIKMNPGALIMASGCDSSACCELEFLHMIKGGGSEVHVFWGGC